MRDGSKRIAALDGWRGIAILAVISSHILSALRLSDAVWPPLSNLGQHGVTIFFVLSGFIVTSTLLKSSGSLRSFYIRRAFRLWPSAWLYLGALAIVGGLLIPPEAFGCLLFFRNFQGHMGRHFDFTQHFWSLSIEEQFYLAWPPILIFAGRRRAAVIAIAVAFLLAANRLSHWSFYAQDYWRYRTEARADALLWGCAAALLNSDTLLRFCHWLAVPAAAVLAYFCCRTSLPPAAESIAIAVLLVATAQVKRGPLVNPGLVWIGRISYSLYIWNVLIFGAIDHSRPWTGAAALIAAFAISALNYYLIEKPSIALGHRSANAINLKAWVGQRPQPKELFEQ